MRFPVADVVIAMNRTRVQLAVAKAVDGGRVKVIWVPAKRHLEIIHTPVDGADEGAVIPGDQLAEVTDAMTRFEALSAPDQKK